MRSMWHGMRWVAALAATLAAEVAAQEKPDAEKRDSLDLKPGSELRLRWAPIDGTVPIYIPTDYDPSRRWPVVFFYHGMGGEPTTDLFRQLTGGTGAVVVGMGYVKAEREPRTSEQKLALQYRELDQLQRLIEQLPSRLRLDRSRVYLAGISKGGWQVSAFAQSGRPEVAGYVILLAGRVPRGRVDRPNLEGRAVYIGNGESDKAIVHSRMAAQFFERCDARVTSEEYPGRGHEIDPSAPRLKAWVDMYLGETGSERRSQAQDWVARRLDKARDTAVAADAYRILSDIAEDPRQRFCGDTLRTQLESLLGQVSLKGDVQPMVQARRIYERALWGEQTADGTSDLEDALDLYEQVAKRYPETAHGKLARHDAARLKDRVDEERTAARARAPKITPPKMIITK